MVDYWYSRLCFKADIIEPLNDEDVFAVHTPVGTFKMTKADFYKTFPNYVRSVSYQRDRIYHIKTPPKKAMKFLVDSPKSDSACAMIKDNVGEEIRSKIAEIGKIWRESSLNPTLDNAILEYWSHVIEEWIDKDDMPLIIRKDSSRKGGAVLHPSGREIIVSDNTFAIWIYNCVMKRLIYSLQQIKKMLLANEIPMVFSLTKDIKEKGKYTKSLGSYALTGWKLCHIESVGFNTRKNIEELDICEIKEHFRKYADPYNMFILPKEIGAIGEIQAFIDEQKKRFL